MGKDINLNKIREMSDENLLNYISYLKSKKGNICSKCYKPDAEYTIFIKQNMEFPSNRKLCCICSDCYNKMVEDLDTEPIEW